MALGLEGVSGIVADSKGYCKRTLRFCLEAGGDSSPWSHAPVRCGRNWRRGGNSSPIPLLVEKPGRTRQEAPRRWHGQSVPRPVDVEYGDGRDIQEELRFLVVRSSQLAQQASSTPPPKPKKPSGSPSISSAWKPAVCLCCRRRGSHHGLCRAWAGPAGPQATAVAVSCGRLSMRWRQPPTKRTRRGRPPKSEAPQTEACYRLVVDAEARPY